MTRLFVTVTKIGAGLPHRKAGRLPKRVRTTRQAPDPFSETVPSKLRRRRHSQKLGGVVFCARLTARNSGGDQTDAPFIAPGARTAAGADTQ